MSSTAQVVTGWRVYAGTRKARAKGPFDLKWAPISQKFVVRSAADQFCDMARRQMPEAEVEVRAQYGFDGVGGP